MKTIIHTILIFIAMQSIISGQCALGYKEILENKCSGVYLRHQDFNNAREKNINLVLTKDNKYAIYLLNPSKSLPKLKVLNNMNLTLKNYQETINTKENFSVYTFTADETGEYGFELDFNRDEKACVLLAIYLLNNNNFKRGIYKSIEEFKYGDPSIEFNCQVSAKNRSVGKKQYAYYKLDLDSRQRKTIGKVFGYCDGKDVFIDINYPKLSSNPEFVRLEYLHKYYFYEYVKYVPIFSGSMVSVFPSAVQKLLDINTGEIKLLNKQTLREILANDQILLDEFDNNSSKDTTLKEYLIRYLTSHYNN